MMKTVLTFLFGAFIGVALGLIVGSKSRLSSQQLTVFTSPNNAMTQRVIGLPGDRVEIRDKVVYVNGKRLDESSR